MNLPPGDQNMPAWLLSLQGAQQANAAAQPMGPLPGSLSTSPQPPLPYPEGSLSVNSLVSEDALPDWVRNADDRNLPGGAPSAQQPWGAGGQAPGSAWGAAGFGAPMGQPMAPAPGWAQPTGMPPSPQLFDDSALPSWLSAPGAPFAGPGAAPQPPAGNTAWGHDAGGPSASPFGIPTGAYGQPFAAAASAVPAGNGTGGLPAQSLLDTSSLPQWLGGQAGGRESAAPEPALGGDGMRAHSLVDERSLPLWLRQEPSASAEAPAPGVVSQWLASPATDEPLPTWLNQVYAAAQVPRMPVSGPVAAPWETPAAGAPPGLGTMAGSQLLDDAALPDWLQAAGAAGAPFAVPAPAPAPIPADGASGAGIRLPTGNQPFAFGGVVPLVSPSEWSGSPDWNGGAVAGPAQAPLSASPAYSGGTGTLASPAGPGPGVGAGGEGFSASDLIDPDVLPAWVQQPGPAAEPVFSSTQGWTNRQPSVNPGYSERAASGQSPSDGGWAEARRASPAAPLDEPNLPPWLRDAEAPAGNASSGDDEMYRSGRWGRVGVPERELPPWLRDGSGSGGRQQYGGPYDAGAGGDQRGWGADAPSAGWGAGAGSYAAQPPSPVYPGAWDGQASGGAEAGALYADRFRDEVPGVQRPFDYAYDHGSMPEEYQPGTSGDTGYPASYQQPRKPRRRRWFGRN